MLQAQRRRCRSSCSRGGSRKGWRGARRRTWWRGLSRPCTRRRQACVYEDDGGREQKRGGNGGVRRCSYRLWCGFLLEGVVVPSVHWGEYIPCKHGREGGRGRERQEDDADAYEKHFHCGLRRPLQMPRCDGLCHKHDNGEVFRAERHNSVADSRVPDQKPTCKATEERDRIHDRKPPRNCIRTAPVHLHEEVTEGSVEPKDGTRRSYRRPKREEKHTPSESDELRPCCASLDRSARANEKARRQV